MKFTSAPLGQRFWAKVIKGDGCWLWCGSMLRRGYGQISVKIDGKHKLKLAHHVAWFLVNGAWPKYLMHKCDNPSCVNPEHLKEGNAKENLRDASVKGRLAGKTSKNVCIRGHQLTPDNRRPNKTRACRKCSNLRTRLWRRKLRDQGYTFS